jgi:membrane-associated phospholipid phosphatase
MTTSHDRAARPPFSATATPPLQRFRARLLLGAVVLGCLGGLALAIDLPAAQWCKTARIPKELLRVLNFAEVFAHGTGVAALLALVLVLDPTLRPTQSSPRRSGDRRHPGRIAFVQMIGAAFAGGLIVDAIKATVERVRPRAADLTALASAFGTFDAAALAQPATSHADVSSFPSGHAAVAAGFAAALAWRYPRAAAAFATIAALAAAQRIVTSAHYPSDVACGAAIGLVGAAICLGPRERTCHSMESTTSS